ALQDQLVAAERLAAFGQVTAAVAHGLGNPLAAIRASAQVALLDAEGPVREQLLPIVADTDPLRQRMRGRPDRSRPVDSRSVITALDAAIQSALGPVRSRSAAQGVRIVLELPPDLPKVRLDPARFEEALLCLIGNALDAMPAGGTLRLAATPAAGRGRPPLGGTGPGMAPPPPPPPLPPLLTHNTRRAGVG